MIGITPLSFHKNVQSSSMVFPLAIFKSKEDRDEIKRVLSPLIDEMKLLVSVPLEIPVNGQSPVLHQIHWILVTDLKMAWQLFDLKRGACMLCKCTTVTDRAAGASVYRTFEREFVPGALLFDGVCVQGIN
jgi:hypothetical protein